MCCIYCILDVKYCRLLVWQKCIWVAKASLLWKGDIFKVAKISVKPHQKASKYAPPHPSAVFSWPISMKECYLTYCRWKIHTGALIFNPVIMGSAAAGVEHVVEQKALCGFHVKDPSNHCLQLISSNHKLYTTWNKRASSVTSQGITDDIL